MRHLHAPVVTFAALACLVVVAPAASAATTTPPPRQVHVLAKSSLRAKVTWRVPARARYVVVSVNGHTTRARGSSATVPAALGDRVRLRALYPHKKTSTWTATLRKPRSAAQKAATADQIADLEAARDAADDRRWNYLAALPGAADQYAAETYQLRIDIEGRTIDSIDLELARLRSPYNTYPAGAVTQIRVNNLENDISTLQIQQAQLRRGVDSLTQEIAELRAAGAGSEVLGPYQDQVDQFNAQLADLDTQIAALEQQVAGLGG